MPRDMDNYVTVAERLALAHDQLSQVITEPPLMLTDVMGYIRATVGLKDGRSATGTASFRLDLQGKSAQATNPIEDCETSAVGRALGMLGYGAKDGIASREEVQEAQRRSGNGASYNGKAAPMCPEHRIAMKLGKDKDSYYCPTKHGEKWYSVKIEEPSKVSDTATVPNGQRAVEDLL